MKFSGPNAGYIEDLYQLYLQNPKLVGESWANYFSTFVAQDVGAPEVAAIEYSPSSNGAVNSSSNGFSGNLDEESEQPLTTDYADSASGDDVVQERIYRMVSALRNRGHLRADVNPLSQGVVPIVPTADVDVSFYKFSEQQLNSRYQCAGFAGEETMRLQDLINGLEIAYCSAIGFEIQHILSQEQRLWLQRKIERRFDHGSYRLSPDQKIRRLQKIIDAELFEEELHKKYVGHKRFSLQGAETVIPMINTILERAGAIGVKGIVLGMAHRGRLNVLRNILGKSLPELFSEFEDQNIFSALGSGDVKYHMGFKSTYMNPEGDPLELELAPNPSHLEFVYPVVEGMVRAKQDYLYGGDRNSAIAVVLHGDAAFIGQGVVAETLNMTGVDAFNNGGSIHIIINNQIGFTTSPEDSRTSTYCTDFAKAIQAPIFHINCENVLAASWASKLAVDFSKRYGRDVVLDLYCYRKYGHNEGDDPSYTQPVIYKEIKKKQPISVVFGQTLIEEGIISEADIETYRTDFRNQFSEAHNQSQLSGPIGEACPVHGRFRDADFETSVPADQLQRVANTLIEHGDDFIPHPKLQKILEKRVQTLSEGDGIDWGFAEGLAFGSLLLEGRSVRLCGQDCGRGTFSQRHLVLHHHETGESYTPFTKLIEPGSNTRIEILNSTLSEAAVVAFEFGYSSIARNRSLVVWEAQFGDFANGAQVIIDQFISSSEQKWHQMSGLVMLLPHGYEGQGPEHSSARLERYLQLCAEGNMTVAVPSNAAQHFHLMRRQGLTEILRPMIVMTPKSLLRFPAANCSLSDLTDGRFQELIVDYFGDRDSISNIVMLSGKVYYDVRKKLEDEGVQGVALVRVEQLYPFPKVALTELFSTHSDAQVTWVQEEPKNMGAWSFCEQKLDDLGVDIAYVGRISSASTATGSSKRHNYETEQFLEHLMDRLEN